MEDNSTSKQSEKLVNAINDGNNTYASDVLAEILAKKVDARYDEVMKKQNG